MNTTTNTVYRVGNGSALLKEVEPDKSFFLLRGLKGERINNEISISEIWISDGPKDFRIHVNVDGIGEISYTISEDLYKQWKHFKDDKRRLYLLIKASSGEIVIKKISLSEHIDIRMSKCQYDKLCEDAKKCGMDKSTYCRKILEGSQPREALTDEQKEVMKLVYKFYADIKNFANALKAEAKKISPKDRPNWIVSSFRYSEWRICFKNTLDSLDRLFKRNK